MRKRIEPEQALHGDAFHFGWSGAASILYLNPPYDTDRACGRLEQRFLERFTQALEPGGALLFVVPHYAPEVSAEYLAAQYARCICGAPRTGLCCLSAGPLVALRADQVSHPDPAIRSQVLAAAADASQLSALEAPAGPARRDGLRRLRFLQLQEQSTDVHGLLAQARPFGVQPQAFGLDVDASQLLGAPMPVALPARPAHIALALSAGMLNGRRAFGRRSIPLPHDSRERNSASEIVTVDRKADKEGRATTETQIQQPRLDMHVLRLDTLAFQQLALGTAPTGAERLRRLHDRGSPRRVR